MNKRLTQLRPLIEQLFELSGTPGMSIGVLHHDTPIYTAHFGRRRASHASPPNDDTLYNVASMTKLMTAGVVSNLVSQGLLGWDVPIQHYLPEFREREDEVGRHATVADLLANRTGLSAQNTFWGTMFEDILTTSEDVPRLACHIPAFGEFGNTFVYSAWGYALITSVIERVTGESFGACVAKYIFEPLGMSRSTLNLPPGDNVVYKHWVGLDGVAQEFPWSEYRGWCDGTGFGGAVGARSSTRELLVMYQSLLRAYDHQTKNQVDSTPGSPFKYARKILSPHVGVGNTSTDKQGYCLGTYRTQLPGNLSFASYNSILLGKKCNRLFGSAHAGRAIYHQVANFTGYTGSILLDPQSQSAIFVLANSLPLFDISGVLGQVLLGALLGENDQTHYIELAKSVKKVNMLVYDAYTSGLASRKTDIKPSFPFRNFEGKYGNVTDSMCYSVHVFDDRHLRISAKGSRLTNYILEHGGGNTFFLAPNRELELSQSMWPFTSLKTRIFTFNVSEEEVVSFTWHHDPTPGSKPETFSRVTENLQAKL